MHQSRDLSLRDLLFNHHGERAGQIVTVRRLRLNALNLQAKGYSARELHAHIMHTATFFLSEFCRPGLSVDLQCNEEEVLCEVTDELDRSWGLEVAQGLLDSFIEDGKRDLDAQKRLEDLNDYKF